MPEVAMNKTIEDFRFLAENCCVGLEVDGYRGYWATQGTEYYVMAAIEQLVKQAGPIGLNHYKNIIQRVTGEGYMGGMNDYFDPPSEAMRKEGCSGPGVQHNVLGIE